jgi:hypothetical protein
MALDETGPDLLRPNSNPKGRNLLEWIPFYPLSARSASAPCVTVTSTPNQGQTCT